MNIDIFNTTNKYNIIYADPPWKYRDKAGKRGAENKYNCMDINDLKELPVKKISDIDCILFIWVTFPLLQDGLDLIKSWGFEYKTIGFNWIKMNKKSSTAFIGMGNYTRSNSEICLIGVKGKPKRIDASISSILFSPIEEHSKKPDVIRQLIVKLIGDKPRIELFTRKVVDGWDSFGNEVDKMTEHSSYKLF